MLAGSVQKRFDSRVVVDDLRSIGLVEASGQVSLSDGQTDGIADAGAQGACAQGNRCAGQCDTPPCLPCALLLRRWCLLTVQVGCAAYQW